MARDYKRRAQKKSHRKDKPVWLFFGAGYLFGALSISVAIWQWLPTESGSRWIGRQPINLSQIDPVARPEQKKAEAKIKPPKFDFYTLLPEMEIVVPEAEIEPAVVKSTQTDLSKDASKYLLQVGSFRVAKDADRLRAKLALIGLVARVHTVTSKTGQILNRVRLGPYHAGEKLRGIRKQLAENGYSILVILYRE